MNHKNDNICEEIVFDDNQQAIELFGSNNKHLSIIEEALDVSLKNRGNILTICGNKQNVTSTRMVFQSLWEKQRAGRTIDVSEINSSIRFLQNKEAKAEKATHKKVAITKSDKKQSHNNDSIYFQVKTERVYPRTPNQATYMHGLRSKTLVFSTGPAGTGKTWLAVARALERYFKGEVKKIILTRPVVEAGENLGFLPGDMYEKIDPYLRPLFDAMSDLVDKKQIDRMMEMGHIEIIPLAFMRGRSLKNAIIILDEAQNTTITQMKMFLTRLGEGSQMIVNGDLSQSDLPTKQRSGLAEAIKKLSNIDDVAVFKFETVDIVRHGLVEKIVKAWG